MSISSLFKLLGAPLANSRWSWGAQRASDGAVFLRVWQDLKLIDEEGRHYMMVATASTNEDDNLGYQERLRHVQSIRSGAPCFMVMCSAKDPETEPRAIAGFDDESIFVGGDVLETGRDFHFPSQTPSRARALAKYGATWVRRAGRKPVSSFTP